MTRRLLAPLALMLGLLIYRANAQSNFYPGMVIHHNGDTLKGRIEFRNLLRSQQTCLFKDSSNQTKRYLPGEIAAWRLDDEPLYFLSRELPGAGKRFVQVLVQGRAALYSYINEKDEEYFYIEKDSFFVGFSLQPLTFYSEERGAYYTRPASRYLGVLKSLLGDCAALSRRIDAVAPVAKEIIALLQSYNHCGSEKPVLPHKRHAAFVLNKGMMLGLGHTNMYAPWPYRSMDPRPCRSAYPRIGVFLDMHSTQRAEHLSLHLGLLYSAFRINGKYLFAGYATPYKSIALQYLQAPVLLRFTYPYGRVRPFVLLGIGNNFLISNIERYQLVAYPNRGPMMRFLTNSLLSNINLYSMAYIGAIGLRAPFGRKLLFGELRLEDLNMLKGSARLDKSTLLFSVNTGITF